MQIDNATLFATLGHAKRLEVFRLLVRRYPDAVPAGEIASALELKASTLSVYLNALQHVNLIHQNREGTTLRYRVNLEQISQMGNDLVKDCCQGRVDLCFRDSPDAKERRRVLFLCSANSARSLMAEQILNDRAKGGLRAASAGTRPAMCAHQTALDVLRQKGHEVTNLQPELMADVVTKSSYDFVFSLCDQAANEPPLSFLGCPIMSHWGLPDPVRTVGSADEQREAFLNVYDRLEHKIERFIDVTQCMQTRMEMQRAVDEIARL